jgi:ArsR family transcriptional regulator, virulence genes transcriptional regulator
MNITEMAVTADRVSDLMKVLSSPKRLMILCQLVGVERSVGDLASLLGMRAAAVSQQLSLLRREDIVAARREGQTIFYSLARDDVRRLIAFLYDTYCAPQSQPNGRADEETP